MMTKIHGILRYQFRLPLPELRLFQQYLFGVALFLYSSMRWSVRLYILDRDQDLTLYISVIVQIVCVTLLLLKACLQRYDAVRILIILVFSSLLVLSAIHSDKLLLWSLLFVLCGQNVSERTLGWSSFSTSMFIIGMSLTMQLQGRNIEMPLIEGSKDIRFSLGFVHPNAASLFCFMLIVSIALLLQQHRIFVASLAILFSFFVFVLFSSRTESLGLAFIAVLYAVNLIPHQRFVRVINIIISLITSCIFILSFAASYLYEEKSKVFLLINKVFSDRLNLLHGYIKGGVTLFGQHPSHFTATGTSSTGDDLTLVADNVYVKAIIVYGIIGGGVILLVLMCSQWYFSRFTQSSFVLYSTPLIMGISEGFALYPDQNVMLIALSHLLYKGLETKVSVHHAKHRIS